MQVKTWFRGVRILPQYNLLFVKSQSFGNIFTFIWRYTVYCMRGRAIISCIFIWLTVMDLQDKDQQFKVFFSKTTHSTLKCDYSHVLTLNLIEFDKRRPAISYLDKEKFQVYFATLKNEWGICKDTSLWKVTAFIAVPKSYSAPHSKGNYPKVWIVNYCRFKMKQLLTLT